MSNTKNPYLLTLPELISAKKKISKVAAFYDPSKGGLKGFDSSALEPTEFREQLRRNFLVNLTDAELGAIVFMFDHNSNRKVDSIEFINEFLRLGNLEKGRLRFENLEAKRRIEEYKKKELEKERKKQERLTAVKIATSWTEADEASAVDKIAKVAFTYDSIKGGLGGFLNVDYLTPTEFKEQLRRVFHVNLTAEETAALSNIYDKYHTGEVDTKEFVYQFFRARRAEIDYHHARQAEKTERKNALDKARQDETVERFSKMTLARTSPATEEERKSALDKIRLAAAFYRRSPFIDAIQKSFESEELAPTAFKELLFNNFEIRLSPGELDAVVTLFDHNCDGNISCVEFMTTFYRIGAEERLRILRQKRQRDWKLAQAAKARQKQAEDKAQAHTQTRIKWPVLPDPEDEIASAVSGKSSPSPLFITADQMNESIESAEGRTGSPFVAGGDSEVTMGSASLDAFKRRAQRKKSTVDILAPDKFAAELARTQRSLVEMYPKCSAATKDFIRDLEMREKEISDLTSSGASLRSGGSLAHKSSQASLSEGSSVTAHRAARRVSKKPPTDYGASRSSSKSSLTSRNNRHDNNELSRQSTASSVYSDYDSFEHSSLPMEPSTLKEEDEVEYGEPYERIEVTLPIIEVDRPKTVHSYSRPGSSKSQTGVSANRGNDGFEKL